MENLQVELEWPNVWYTWSNFITFPLPWSSIQIKRASNKLWELKGYKHVSIHGMEDKWPMVALFSSTCDFLFLKVVFNGSTARSLSPLNVDKRFSKSNGWHLTNANHWFTLLICKDFALRKSILLRLTNFNIELTPRSKTCLAQWLLKLHEWKEFMWWMNSNHLEARIIHVECTNMLQLADIIIQQTLDHAFMLQFNSWTMYSIPDFR